MVPSKEWAQGKIVVIEMHERVVGNGKHRSRKMQERERHQMKKKASLYLVSRSWCSLGRQVIRMFYMFKAFSTPCDRFQCMKMPDACDPLYSYDYGGQNNVSPPLPEKFPHIPKVNRCRNNAQEKRKQLRRNKRPESMLNFLSDMEIFSNRGMQVSQHLCQSVPRGHLGKKLIECW